MRELRSINRTDRRVAILSDVHLRAPWDSTVFRADWSRLRDTVELLLASDYFVVLNGDIFDLDRGATPMRHDAKARSIPEDVRTLLSEWQDDGGVALLTGNHELWAGCALRAAVAVDLPWGEFRRLRVEHGERFDGWAKRIRPFTSFVTWVSGLAERDTMRPLLRGMRRIERTVSNGSAEHEVFVTRIRRWLASRPGYQAFVFGHTHRAGVWTRDGVVVANAGEFRGDAATMLLLDTVDATVRVVTLDTLQHFAAE